MLDGGVDLVDSRLELAACQVVVAVEALLESQQLFLKLRDIDVLLAYELELLLVGKRVHGSVAQQRDHGNEELRANHVHLLVAIAHGHDARVVQLALRLKQSDQHRVLAALLLAVRIELLEEVLVLVLGGRGVVLVLHLEHDRDDLVTGVIALAEDEVALGTVGGVVVLLKVGMRERRGTQLIELGLAVLLEGLAHHLGGEARLHIAQALDLLVLVADEVLSALAGLLDQDVPVLMTNFPTILNRLTGMFSEDRSEFIASFDEYDLLIIDDLGVERSTEYAMEQMFFVIDSRYRSRRPMIITTNLKLSELKNPPDLAHARIYDRILERCAPILFNGKNFREENAGATRQTAKDIVNSKQD